MEEINKELLEKLINNERFKKLDEIVGSGIIEGNIFPTEDDIYLK